METDWLTPVFPMKLYNFKLVHEVIMALEPAPPKPLLSLPLTSSAKKLSPKIWFVQEQKSYVWSSWKRSIVFLLNYSCTSAVQAWNMASLSFTGNETCKLELNSPKSLALFVYCKPRIYYQGQMDVVQAPIAEAQSTWKVDSWWVQCTYLLRARAAWPTLGVAQSRAPGLSLTSPRSVIRDFEDNIEETLSKAG